METKLKKLEIKKQKLDILRPFPLTLVENLEEWLNIELTYTSNAIEGNTLSRMETALVIEKGITVKGKTLKEHLEAVNHIHALNYIKTLAEQKRSDIGEKEINEIHRIILHGIDETNAGVFRKTSVRIAGSRVILPNPLKVPELMSEFFVWLHQTKDYAVKIAALAHFKLVSIHPYVDGNGRTARLLLNLILMQEGYPPAIIKKEDRLQYLNSIEKGQLQDVLDDYYNIIYDAVDQTLNIYLNAIQNKEPAIFKQKQKLLKIGEIANLTGESVPTIRYWTKEGLIKVDDFTIGGYQLYSPEVIKTVKKIRNFQKTQRLSIKELRETINKPT